MISIASSQNRGAVIVSVFGKTTNSIVIAASSCFFLYESYLLNDERVITSQSSQHMKTISESCNNFRLNFFFTSLPLLVFKHHPPIHLMLEVLMRISPEIK